MQEGGLEKREREKFIFGLQQPGKAAESCLHNQPLCGQDGHLEFYEDRLWGMFKKAGREQVVMDERWNNL